MKVQDLELLNFHPCLCDKDQNLTCLFQSFTGQEPIITKDGDISCEYCQDPERYNPVLNTPSNEISECPRKKSKCVKGITCQNTEPKYMQNRLCRCDNTNNFLPLNYNFDEDSFICVEEDELECVQVPCPVTVHGSKQIRGQGEIITP